MDDMEIRIKKGLDLPLVGAPQQTVSSAAPVNRVAFIGSDFLSLRQLPRVLVSEGQHVRLGEPLVRSKRHPEIVGVAPGCGVVERIVRGEKRSLKAITIRLEGDEAETFGAYDPPSLEALSASQVRETLLASGLWLALRTRPYSMTPMPDSEPDAVYVSAMDTQPLAPQPDVIIADSPDDFISGLRVVRRLCQDRIYLCAAAGTVLPGPCAELTRVVRFSGPHPAGLVGTHIHHFTPLAEGSVVWTINYQDVMAIGRLFASGRLSPERVVALSGPLVSRPCLVRTRIGASLADLLEGEFDGSHARVLSGSVLSGRHATGWAAYLGWFHHQVTVIKENLDREFLGWIAPGSRKFSALPAFSSHWRAKGERFDLDTAYHGSPRAMVPIGVYERVMPLDLLITPLLRALLVGDVEAAIELGCLELDEEDLALCSFVCPSKHDFGAALRDVLDRIQREG